MLTTLIAALGIMSAMHEECHLIHSRIENPKTTFIGSREFISGSLNGINVVCVQSGIGKVSASVTATLLAKEFHVEDIIFTGLAGGGPGAQIGDIVIGTHYLQHDVDARPFFPLFHIHTLNAQVLKATPALLDLATSAAERFLSNNGIHSRVLQGAIITGEQFIGSKEARNHLLEKTNCVLPNGFYGIEMEGAAVVQTCQELGIGCVVVRTISDQADGSAPSDFQYFLDHIASRYSLGIVENFVNIYAEQSAKASRNVSDNVTNSSRGETTLLPGR